MKKTTYACDVCKSDHSDCVGIDWKKTGNSPDMIFVPAHKADVHICPDCSSGMKNAKYQTKA